MEVERIHFEKIESTNSWAKEHAKELDPKKLSCITADMQTMSYGRQGRPWISKKGNLHMSLFFRLSPENPVIPNLGQLISFACLKALPDEVQIKWPNDLLYDGKKLCGVLVEVVSIEKELGVVVGVGINVNAHVETDQPTISLFEITGKHWDLEQLSLLIAHQFQMLLDAGFSSIKDEYDSRLAYRGKRIQCMASNEQIQGILLGMNDQGQLQIKKDDGSILQISSGDIQLLRSL